MMKRHINPIALVLLTIAGSLLTACDDFLDITPDGQMKRSELLESAEGIEDALYGAYSKLRSNSLYGQELSYQSVEVMAQTMECPGNNAITALGQYNYDYSTVKSMFEQMWTEMYANISNVNSILASSLVADADSYPYNIYKGEALGLRAFMHFDLMRLFTDQITQNPQAGGIPYATDFSLFTPDFESAADNYRHVIGDLRQAEQLLADEPQHEEQGNFMKDRQIHINLYAVKALLARVYLTMGRKDSALVYARDVIDHSPYRLSEKTEVAGDLAGVLSRKETIWGVYWAGFYQNVSAKLQQTTSYYSLNPRADIMDIYNEDVDGLDYRQTAYFSYVDLGSTQRLRLSKLTDVYELQNITSSRPSYLLPGINLIRLPEMYYICAEALLDTDYDQAVVYFDTVLEHRGLTPLAQRAAGQLTQELINRERLKELIGEGQTFFNLKRQWLPLTAADGRTWQPANDIYTVPIPETEYSNRY